MVVGEGVKGANLGQTMQMVTLIYIYYRSVSSMNGKGSSLC